MTKFSCLAKSQAPNAFHWQGKPSTLLDKMGRIKTDRQMLLDATRTNLSVELGAHGKAKSETAPR